MKDLRFKDIVQGVGHPYSKLKQLEDAKLVKTVAKEEKPSCTISEVQITVVLLDDTIVSRKQTGCGIQKLKQEVAQQALTAIIIQTEHSEKDVPRDSLTNTFVASKLTAKQSRQVADDTDQLSNFCSFLEDYFIQKDTTIIMSVDLEQWERDTSITLEVGISVVPVTKCFGATREEPRTFHIINKDALHLHNGLFCPDNRDNFIFGTSIYVSSDDLVSAIRDIIMCTTLPYKNAVFAGHTTSSDMKWLVDMGVDMSIFSSVCDIAKVYRAITSPQCFTGYTGMEKMLTALDVRAEYLHNGGNDAYYNLRVIERLGAVVMEAFAQTSALAVKNT